MKKLMATVTIILTIFTIICWTDTFSMKESKATEQELSIVKYYNKNTKLTIKNGEGYRKVLVNGKKVSFKKKAKSVKISLKKEGKYVIRAYSAKGNMKKILVYMDKTRPDISGASNNKKYKRPVNIKISDNLKLTKCSLNGTLLTKNVFKLTESGKYTLYAKDMAGNETKISFSISIDKDESEILSSDWEYSIKGKEIILQKYKGSKGNIEIEDSYYINGEEYTVSMEETTAIDDGVFSKNDQITSIVFKKGFTFPEDMSNAFYECKNLTKIVGLENGNFSNAKAMCYGCTNLDCAITLPKSVKNINSTFANCTSLKLFPRILSTEVETMASVCSGCTSLNDVNLDMPKSSNYSSAFANCIELEPSSVAIPDGATNINKMFYGCEKFNASVNIPDTVVKANETFYKCTSLKEVAEWSGANSKIETAKSMYYGCSGLNSLPAELPGNLETMDSMFQGCSAAETEKSVDIPNTVKSAKKAFYGCEKMQYIPYIKEDSVLIDATSMMQGCKSMKKGNTYLPETLSYASFMFQDCTNLGADSSKSKIYAYVDTAYLKESDSVFCNSGYDKNAVFYILVKKQDTYKKNGRTVSDNLLFWEDKVPEDICIVKFEN